MESLRSAPFVISDDLAGWPNGYGTGTPPQRWTLTVTGVGQEADVALARISYTYAEGQCIDLEVDSGDGDPHPDLLDELVKRVLDLYRSTVGGE